MNIAVKGNQVKENRALEDYAYKKASKLYHYFADIVKIEVELRSEVAHKRKEDDFICDITLHIPGKTLKISDQKLDMYTAIDFAANRMSELLRREKGKHKGRLKTHFSRAMHAGFGYFPAVWHSVNKRIFRRS